MTRSPKTKARRDIEFAPELSPQQMLELGVFGGAYFDGDIAEYPPEWFTNANLSANGFDADLNRFGVAAGQSRAVWQEKGWITTDDPLGWFQWYCRYSMGRRLPGVDAFQIRRWYQFGARHLPQIRKNCEPGDVACRPRQRQAVLQWAYDPFV
ncbi:MAG: hypothetical protein O3A84_01545 [Proteobacteria bacterium]|nr:hypothetical protein [Pseudomonadota bacterium]